MSRALGLALALPKMAASALLGALAALATLAASGRAEAQYCPCYTLSSPSNNEGCGVEAVNGTNPSHDEWNAIFDLVSQGPAVWGDKGPPVTNIGQGCGKPEPLHSVPARFPCELLKGIAMQESGWRQFCVPTTPGDQVGGPSRTIISFDCGYGIGQVTSGMHTGENPDFDRERVAGDPVYNLATGTRILASKWKATECVGDNQPSVIEHWYAATWAYNGLAYVNNPNNPAYDANRGVWDYKVKPSPAAPYQEKVFGWIEHTPHAEWIPTKLAYPNPGDIQSTNEFPNSPPELPEPSCASPTDCANERPTHTTLCNGQPGSGGAGGSSGQGGSAGQGGSEGPAGVGGGGAGDPTGSGGDASGQGSGATGGATGGGDDGGCTCRAAPAPTRTPGMVIAAALSALLFARRAKKAGRRTSAAERARLRLQNLRP
jgi:hypothetical protein